MEEARRHAEKRMPTDGRLDGRGIDQSERARIVEWNDWKSRGSLIGLRADGSVVAIHALGVVRAACQGVGVAGGGCRRRTSRDGREETTAGTRERRPESLNVGTDTAL